VANDLAADLDQTAGDDAADRHGLAIGALRQQAPGDIRADGIDEATKLAEPVGQAIQQRAEQPIDIINRVRPGVLELPGRLTVGVGEGPDTAIVEGFLDLVPEAMYPSTDDCRSVAARSAAASCCASARRATALVSMRLSSRMAAERSPRMVTATLTAMATGPSTSNQVTFCLVFGRVDQIAD
jgi:hypothetical protein